MAALPGHLSNALGGDRNFIMSAVQIDGLALCMASRSLKKDREVVLKALENDSDGTSSHFADDCLREDREVILASVQRRGRALELVADSLRADREIVRQGIITIGDHPGHAALSAAVSCSRGHTSGNGTSIESAPTAGMSRNLHFVAMTTACGVGSCANIH